MALDQYYFDKRPLTLEVSATADQALSALDNDHVGAVMVVEEGRLVGIVTDRDLALRVFRAHRDPSRTQLNEIMTTNPHSLPPSASEAQAAMLMRAATRTRR